MQNFISLESKSLNSEIDVVLGRGTDFFNRFFITSLQNSFVQGMNDINRVKLLQKSKKSRVDRSFYSIELDEDRVISHSFHLLKDGKFYQERDILKGKETTKEEEKSRYLLIDGEWRSEYSSYKLKGDSIVVDNLYKIDISSKDISGKYSLDGVNITMPRGAKLERVTSKLKKELFILNRKISDIKLVDFIKSFSKLNWFDGCGCGGISFGDTSSGLRAGKIWYINRVNGKLEIVSKDVGEWRVESFGGNDILIIKLKEHRDMIFANIDNTLYQGVIIRDRDITKEFYNKIAFDEISRVIEKII